MHAGKQQAQKDLGELAGMQRQTDAMSKKIHESAVNRLGVVQKSLGEPGASTRDDYQDLITERGQLQQVISSASAD